MYIVVMNEININDLWERLKKLCKENKVTLAQLCVDIGTLPQNMNNKKYRKTVPTIEELVKISAYFNTTLDYLILGKNENPLQSRVDELTAQLKLINDITSR